MKNNFLAGILTFLILLSSCYSGIPFLLEKDDPLARTAWLNEEIDSEGRPENLTANIRRENEDVLFKDETSGINIVSQKSCLEGNYQKIYLTLFTDYTGRLEAQRLFDEELTSHLKQHGLNVVSRIGDAEAIISGSLDSFQISDSRIVTNVEGSLYTLVISCSVTGADKEIVIDNEVIKERLLVLDTNTYPTNIVIPMMIKTAAEHASELLYYGYISEIFDRNSIEVLGESDETGLSTNGN